MLALSAPIVAAAYLLLGQPGHAGQLAQDCRVGWDGGTICTALALPPAHPPCVDDPKPANRITVRWVGQPHHHRRCRRWRRGWRCW